MLQSKPGFYIAFHEWLNHHSREKVGANERLHKVGHSGCLARRLNDSCYVTSFIGRWEYKYTLETENKENAEIIERAVLTHYSEVREDCRELLLGPSADEILSMACSIAERFGISIVVRTSPRYIPPPQQITNTNSTLSVKQRELLREMQIDKFVFSVEQIYDYSDNLIAELYSDTRVQPPKKKALDVRNETTNIEDRAYQTEAANACLEEMKANGKCIMQLPCRSGKTRIAHIIMMKYMEEDKTCRILYLVPSLTLLRQTSQKIISYSIASEESKVRNNILLVGSDPVVVPIAGGLLRMTTERKEVEQFLATDNKQRIVICMYQSSHLVQGCNWSLIVSDEAHKIVGGTDERPMNLIACQNLESSGQFGNCLNHRLFMTATPDFSAKGLSMNNRDVFGGVAYRYYLRQAIDAGYVNDFQLRIIAANTKDADPLVSQIIEAMRTPGNNKMLVFCKLNTADAESLCRRVKTAVSALPGKDQFECLTAHSKMNKAAQNSVLEKFSADGRAVLFNCRLFQEGVEIPSLNSVFFAAPRHSPRDIIQSICRPLNKLTNKPISTIFLPVTLDKIDVEPEGDDLARFADILPVFDALAHEDKRLYEYLMGSTHKCTKECANPCELAYPIDILGTRSLGLKTAAQKKKLLLAVRKATRYTTKGAKRTFMQPKNIPWTFALGAIRDITEKHNRYPVTGEKIQMGEERVNIHSYLKWCADEYLKFKDGKKSLLEPYQVNQLEELKSFSVFGVFGPYPVKLCLEYLEEYMDENDGNVPMVNLSHRECVALDATKIERLCGFCRIINMNDMSVACRVNKDVAGKLDEIFSKFGLNWRKKRRADGSIDTGEPSLFQIANQKLNQYYRDFKRGLNDGAYIRENFIHGQYDS